MSDTTSRKYSLAELNALPITEFITVVGGIFECSPWIAEAATQRRPFSSREALLAAMATIIQAADTGKQLALIKAYPDLAGRLAQSGQLTPESVREHAMAGLTQVQAPVLEKIQSLNSKYCERFGFPFIICARLNSVDTILTAMEQRLEHSREKEFASALQEISKIAQLRLADIIKE
jgi:2-oxo-4-hydroxy-4-carboxy-5-ureidoimidazoline decarboxylase